MKAFWITVSAIGSAVILAVVIAASIAATGNTGQPRSATQPAAPAAHHTSAPAPEPSSTRQPSLFVTEATNIWPTLSEVSSAKLISLGDTMCEKRSEGVSQRTLIKAASTSAASALGINDVQRFVLLAEVTLCPGNTAPVIKVDTPTTSQNNALRSAQDYLSMDGFSRLGLIGQLSSKYGDGYSKADAVWAVNHVHANWNAEAVKSAKSYLQMSGFSRSGLIDQLSSPYGDKYTVAQATYAANKVGL